MLEMIGFDRKKSAVNEQHITKADPLSLFFFITLAWTWVIGFIPLWCGIANTTLADILFKALVGPAPTIVGLIMVFVFYNRKQQIDYLKRCFDIRMVGWKIPLLLVLMYSSGCGLSILISTQFFHGSIPQFAGIQEIIRAPYLIFLYLFFALISGPLNEEFGWRGFSLDHLLARFGFVNGSLILGFVWGIWHLPWYFYEGNGQYIAWSVHPVHGLFMIVSAITTALMCSVVYILRNRSVIAAALVHLLSNFLVGGTIIYPFDNTYIITSLYVVAAIEVIVVAIIANTKQFKLKYMEVVEGITKIYTQSNS
jgi:membrane protease YdiL (CAAX protease family)